MIKTKPLNIPQHLREDFLSRVEVRGPNECWIWRGSMATKDYGRWYMGGRAIRAHRAAHELFNGHIPDDLLVLHSCDNPKCVNPAHLRAGTSLDNSADCKARHRHSYGPRPYQVKGTQHGCAVLTEEQVNAIRIDSRPHKDVAPFYGVSSDHIKKIRNWGNWKHLPIPEGAIWKPKKLTTVRDATHTPDCLVSRLRAEGE